MGVVAALASGHGTADPFRAFPRYGRRVQAPRPHVVGQLVVDCCLLKRRQKRGVGGKGEGGEGGGG